MEQGDIFLSPELEDTLYLLTIESRLKELKQQCEGLVEQSKRLRQDGQQLREDFEADMKLSQALQRDLERQLLSLRSKQEAMREFGNNLQQFLKDHRVVCEQMSSTL